MLVFVCASAKGKKEGQREKSERRMELPTSTRLTALSIKLERGEVKLLIKSLDGAGGGVGVETAAWIGAGTVPQAPVSSEISSVNTGSAFLTSKIAV